MLKPNLAVEYVIILISFLYCNLAAETLLQSKRTARLTHMIWTGQLASAADSCQRLIVEEPGNPLGYLLTGIAYYSINIGYRNDFYADSVTFYLDTAIKIAENGDVGNRELANRYFILGSAYGCRALYRSIHGGWWGAFRDGYHSCSNLEKAYGLDSTFSDALSGIGGYHYWKSVKIKKLAFLPFIADRRNLGISEIYRSLQKHGIMTGSARKSLLAIYFNEKQYEKAVILADSLRADGLLDENSHLHMARALIELKRYAQAEEELDAIQSAWGKTTYGDSCGASEILYLKAKISLGRGDTASAADYLKRIFSMTSICTTNAYFRKTISDARNLH